MVFSCFLSTVFYKIYKIPQNLIKTLAKFHQKIHKASQFNQNSLISSKIHIFLKDIHKIYKRINKFDQKIQIFSLEKFIE
jgi:hypothetical protein